MKMLMTMIGDLAIIAVLASFCDMLLPETGVKRPVQLVFGLYFMALMLNPLVTLWTDRDFSAMDFSTLGEVNLIEASEEYDESMVYREAAATLGEEIKMRLEEIYEGGEAKVSVAMEEKGFTSVSVVLSGDGFDHRVVTAEIRELLVKDYGIPREVLNVTVK